MQRVESYCWLALFLALLFVTPLASWAREAEELLAEINRLPPKEREARLIEGAKKEGSLNWYGNIEMTTMRNLNEGFQKRYPFIKAQYWRGSGAKLVDRILLEARSKKLDVDVFFLPFESISILRKEKILARYVSPEKRFFPAESMDKEAHWAAVAINYATIAYNTKIVSSSQIPKSYEELLNPKWSGEVSIDMEPDRAMLGWLKFWGEKKTETFIRGLVNNRVIVRRGHTLQTQLLCAGEFKLASELYAYRVIQMKHERGCPVGIIYANPVSGSVTPVALAHQAPRPHAAALFMDFVLTEEGQKIVVESGRIPTRVGVKAKYEEVSNLEEKGVPIVFVTPEDAEKWEQVSSRLVNEVIIRKQR